MFDKEKLKEDFLFNSTTYNYRKLKEFTEIKTYEARSDFERKLVKDEKTGCLFLYEFYEYEDFDLDIDEMYETYALVKDERDADTLNKEREIRRSPYIRVMPNFDIVVQ